MNPAHGHLGARLQDELAAVADAGISVIEQEVDGGFPVWTCVLEHDYDTVTVKVRVGEGFPWLPPTVTSDEPFLQRHQVPSRNGSFCLDRIDAPWWRPEHRIVDLLQHLQHLLDADSEGAARVEEADMPEPASAFLSGAGFPVILLSRTMLGSTIGASSGTVELTRIDGANARWLVTALRANDGKIDLRPEARPSWLTLGRQVATVPWTDIGEVRDRNGVERATRAVLDMAPPRPRRRQDKRVPHSWRAVTFMEEGPTRQQTRRAWAFAQVGSGHPLWAAAQALSPAQRDSRRSALIGLGAARVAVFGLGTLGASIAMLLAQAGVVDFDLVDHDEFDINNGVRHILPADALGCAKATATAEFLNAQQPFCSARAHELNVGTHTGSLDAAAHVIGEADLVVDATGALTVSRFLGACAASANVPILHSALIAGGEVGYVFARRRHTGCLDHFLDSADHGLPSAAALPNSTPYGCSHPAVSCAPFEPAQLAVHAARTAAGILDTAAYPEFEHDWLTARLQHATAATVGDLPKVPGCYYCEL